ncbi:putative transcriptional regulator YdeE [Saonia flava]|uniref:Putative transcriptional regulator YdeE n=1 Tax=Saonia flava TaxID=523696 RepID=A0A846QZ75_9FLAO|nr:GyrI-like domain-containing protein [Saonia flava]NJB72230.1 putative transcriptional regulator YdeE [Saonia flava]
MKKHQLSAFQVIGISVRTTNENGQAKKDIGNLWSEFMSKNIVTKIPNVLDETIYAVYTDYDKDHTKPYTTILGYKVWSLDTIPEGMVGKEIEPATYTKFTAKGDLTDNAVKDEWDKIWNTDLNRTYISDFEVYGKKAIDPTHGEADIYIGVK